MQAMGRGVHVVCGSTTMQPIEVDLVIVRAALHARWLDKFAQPPSKQRDNCTQAAMEGEASEMETNHGLAP